MISTYLNLGHGLVRELLRLCELVHLGIHFGVGHLVQVFLFLRADQAFVELRNGFLELGDELRVHYRFFLGRICGSFFDWLEVDDSVQELLWVFRDFRESFLGQRVLPSVRRLSGPSFRAQPSAGPSSADRLRGRPS